MQLDSIDLPVNLYWRDEFAWRPAAQSTQRSVGGGFVVQAMPLQYGRPITLVGAWAKRDEVQALKALEADAGTKRTLTLNDGTTLTVLFDIENALANQVLLNSFDKHRVHAGSDTCYSSIGLDFNKRTTANVERHVSAGTPCRLKFAHMLHRTKFHYFHVSYRYIAGHLISYSMV